MNTLPDILLIDKPAGITSMDVIRQLRKRFNIKKMGHAGTLDPLATGLMIIGIGPGTKKLTDFIKLDKEYVAEVRIGEQRSTGDLEGEIVAERSVIDLAQSEVELVLKSMVATLTLEVSAYSAIKVDGVPMYKRARKAETKSEHVTELPIREMKVFAAELLKYSCENGRAVATVRFHVGSGTYIRSLAEELGRRLGYPATLQNLRRTKVGIFSIEDAKTIEEI